MTLCWCLACSQPRYCGDEYMKISERYVPQPSEQTYPDTSRPRPQEVVEGEIIRWSAGLEPDGSWPEGPHVREFGYQ